MLIWCHICSYLIIKKGAPLCDIQCRFAAFCCINGASIKMQKYLVGLTSLEEQWGVCKLKGNGAAYCSPKIFNFIMHRTDSIHGRRKCSFLFGFPKKMLKKVTNYEIKY